MSNPSMPPCQVCGAQAARQWAGGCRCATHDNFFDSTKFAIKVAPGDPHNIGNYQDNAARAQHQHTHDDQQPKEPAMTTDPLDDEDSLPSDDPYPAIRAAIRELQTLHPGFNAAVNRAHNILYCAYWDGKEAPTSEPGLRPESASASEPQFPPTVGDNLFAVGDVVQLNSGGPMMTVSAIGPRKDPHEGDVTCIWYEEASDIRMFGQTFPSETLMNESAEHELFGPGGPLEECAMEADKFDAQSLKSATETGYGPLFEDVIPPRDPEKFGVFTIDSAIEQEIQAKGKTAPRVTPADIEAAIATVREDIAKLTAPVA